MDIAELSEPDKALIWAAMRGDLEAVRAALGAGADPDAPDAIAELAARGADVELGFEGPHERSPLAIAAAHGSERALAALIEAGADLDARSASGKSPMEHAAAKGHPGSLLLLARAGARGDPAALLAAACSADSVGCVHALLEWSPALRGAAQPAARAACDAMAWSALAALALGGAAVDWTEPPVRAALARVALGGHISQLRALLGAGFPPDSTGPDGWSPLASVAMAGDPEAALALLGAGADPWAATMGPIPMDIALREARPEMLAVFEESELAASTGQAAPARRPRL